MEGIGSTHQQAVQPVSDDLFFLAALGVRTVSIAEGSNNLASGDVGVPLDILIQADVAAVDVEPVASYYPGAGQFWLAFRPLTIAAAILAGQFLLTSTIYPVEAIDGMGLTVSLISGSMQAVGQEALDMSVKALDGNITQLLLSTGPHDEALDMTVKALDGNITVALVTGLMPDEGIDLTVSLISGSMTAV